jgi:hypothetical protein
MSTVNFKDMVLQQQNQKKTMDQLSDIIQQSSQSLLCGPGTACAREQEEETLRKEYVDAQANVRLAPEKFKESAKKYYTFTKGTAAYNDWLETNLTKEAEQKAQDMWSVFIDQLKQVEMANETLSTLASNENNANDLHEKYLLEIQTIRNKLTNKTTTIATNDRKTYYERENIQDLYWWYTLFLVAYYLLVVVFIVSLFLFKPEMTILKKILFFVFFVIYPFVIDYIVRKLWTVLQRIYSFFPKNVYKTL